MPSKTSAWLSLIFISIAWGTTYLAIKIGVTAFPSFLYAGIRQVAAGLIILIIASRLAQRPDLSRRNLLRQLLIGFLMITLGNGLVTWGETRIQSGTAALICAMMPVFAVLINVGINRKERLNILIIGGMLLGFCGVAINFRHNLADLGNAAYIGGIAATFCATTSWAIGSIIGRRTKVPPTPYSTPACSCCSAGSVCLPSVRLQITMPLPTFQTGMRSGRYFI